MSYLFVARTLLVAAAAAVLAGVHAQASSAGRAPAAGAYVEVTPSTVQDGEQVDIQASCDGNDQPATVRSDAFGQASVRPDNGLLTGVATIPDRKPPGVYEVVLTCRDRSTASTKLTVVNMGSATRGPATGAGGTAGGTVDPLVLTGVLGAVAVGAGMALAVRARRGTGSRS